MTIKQRFRYVFWSLVLILAPILYGMSVYDKLPATMAIHWGAQNQANGFVAKPLAVFGLPLIMLMFQVILMSVTWLNSMRKGAAQKFEKVSLSVLPVISLVIYIATIMANLNKNVNIWAIAMTIVAFVFIAIGNYLPTIPAEYNRGPLKPNWQAHPEAWKKTSRQMGFVMVGGGFACLLSLLAGAIASVVVLVVVVVAVLVVSYRGFAAAK
ncbi:DUF1648 domain-containing protein [Lacticaseibacillus hulanensis]|jgi:uncharacterized membrane protein|uniref:DUF1648 domain-containing protein n=1 Tax=Lacticaseibacillus hulanensis TaxID=2493111 RepID=UPI000FD6E3B4|nr:DUF1648 domain-containing protein [Lacticaseibacillus hulanensis]